MYLEGNKYNIVKQDSKVLFGSQSRYKKVNNTSITLKHKEKYKTFDFDLKYEIKFSSAAYKESVYFSINDRLYEFNGELRLISEFPSIIIWLSSDKEGNLWCGLINNGIYKIPFGATDKTLFKNFLPGESVSSIHIDNAGGHWFTTLNNGLFYCGNITARSYDKSAFKNLHFTSICKAPNENVLIGTEEGEIIDFDLNIPKYIEASMSKNNHIFKISRTNNQTYVSTTLNNYKIINNKLVTFLDERESYMVFPYHTNGSKSHFIFKDKIYLAGHNGYKIFKENMFYDHTPVELQSNSKDVAVLNDSVVFLATIDGLRKDIGRDTFWLRNINKALGNPISQIALNKAKDKIWVAAGTGGLVLLLQDSIYVVDHKNGLNFKQVTKIAIQNDSTLFVGSETGGLAKVIVHSFFPFKFQVENFCDSKGLASKIVKDMMVSNDTLWVVSTDNLSIVPLNNLKLSPQTLKIYIEEFEVNNNPFPLKNGVKLSHNENNLIGLPI